MANVLNSQNVDPSRNIEEIGLKGIFNPISGSKMEETLRMVIREMDVSMFQDTKKQISSTIPKKEQKSLMKFDVSSIDDKYYKRVNNLDEEIRRIENGKKAQQIQETEPEKSKIIIPIGTKTGITISSQATQRAINSTRATTLGTNSYYKRVTNLDSAIKDIEKGTGAEVLQSSSGIKVDESKKVAKIIQYESIVREKDTKLGQTKKKAYVEVSKSKVKKPEAKKETEVKPEKAKQPRVKKETAAKPEKAKQPRAKKETAAKPEKVKQPRVKKETVAKPEKVKQPRVKKEKRMIERAETIKDPNRLTEPKKRNFLKRIILQMKYDTGKYEFIEDGYLKGNISREELEFYKNSPDREDRKYYKEVQEYEDITKDVAVSRGWMAFKLGLATTLLAGTLIASNNVIQGVKNNFSNMENENVEITLEHASKEELDSIKQKITLIKKSSNYDFENLEEDDQLLAFLKIKDAEKDISARSFQGQFFKSRDQEFLEEILKIVFEDEYSNYSDAEKRDLKKLVFELLPEEKKQYVRDPEVLRQIEQNKVFQEQNAKSTKDEERN